MAWSRPLCSEDDQLRDLSLGDDDGEDLDALLETFVPKGKSDCVEQRVLPHPPVQKTRADIVPPAQLQTIQGAPREPQPCQVVETAEPVSMSRIPPAYELLETLPPEQFFSQLAKYHPQKAERLAELFLNAKKKISNASRDGCNSEGLESQENASSAEIQGQQQQPKLKGILKNAGCRSPLTPCERNKKEKELANKTQQLSQNVSSFVADIVNLEQKQSQVDNICYDGRRNVEAEEKRVQGRCYGVTQVNQNPFELIVPFVVDVPEMPRSLRVTVDEWRRVYTVLKNYATGSNERMERWLSITALSAIYGGIFHKTLSYSAWGATGPKQFGRRLGSICKVWVDAFGYVFVRLARPGQSIGSTITWPATKWAFLDLKKNPDWESTVTTLMENVDAEMNGLDYLNQLLRTFRKNHPSAGLQWVRKVRYQVYAMLVCHFPLGMDPECTYSAFQKMYGSNPLSGSLEGRFTLEVLYGEIMRDLVIYIRESRSHAMVYPRFDNKIEIPRSIRTSRSICNWQSANDDESLTYSYRRSVRQSASVRSFKP